MLKPALRRLWRGPATLQLGVDPARAVVVDGVDGPTRRVLGLLDGTRDEAGVLAAAAAEDIDPVAAAALLRRLADAAALADGAADTGPLARLPDTERSRLGPDRAAWSLRPRTTAAQVLARRRAAAVTVVGAGRVGAPLAALLSAAGVGAVRVLTGGDVAAGEAVPGGVAAADVGRPRRDAITDALRRAAPERVPDVVAVARAPGAVAGAADLVVLTAADPPPPELVAALHRAATPHLVCGVRDTAGVVGPLVLPGRSACLRCADRWRADRDPAWALLAAQLTADPAQGRPDEPCEVALAAAVAASAALQALAHLDGDPVAVVDGSLELSWPDWRTRRRTWLPHPRCDCGANAAAPAPHAASA